jgi:hypothetical protein
MNKLGSSLKPARTAWVDRSPVITAEMRISVAKPGKFLVDIRRGTHESR